MSEHKHLFNSTEDVQINGRGVPTLKPGYVFEGAKCKLCDTLMCGKFLTMEVGTKYRCTLAQGHEGKCTNTHVGVTAP